MDRLQRTLDPEPILPLIVWELVDTDKCEQRVVDELSEPHTAGHEQDADHIR
jgi:hypothetical protein